MPKDLAKKNRELRQEALRNELKAREYLRQIEEVANVVSAEWRELNAQQVGALKLKADVNFKRLDKVLPDLKAVEIEHLGEVVQRVINAKPMTADEWAEQYADDMGTTSGASEVAH